MRWLLRLYPARWRERYGEEFGAVLASQRATPGLVLDVFGGAIDAHLHPQFHNSHSKQAQGDEMTNDTMTLQMMQRCAAGGPKLSPSERRVASRLSIVSALVMATLYLVLTKIYREAPAVQAILWTSIFFPTFIYKQTVYLKKRSWLTQGLVLGAWLSAMYLFMLAVFLLAKRV
jgi:hypothetical protein